MNSEERRRYYLQALEISIWLPRRLAANLMATPDPAAALLEQDQAASLESAPVLAASVEPAPVEDQAAIEPVAAESWTEPDWVPALDDDWELMTDSDPLEDSAVTAVAVDNRAARIAEPDRYSFWSVRI